MSSRWKKILADFWSNKGRTFITILTIMVGTLAVGFNSNLGLFMNQSMDGDYLSAQPSEAAIYTSPFGDDLVKMARQMPGVDGVEGRASTSAHLIPVKGEPISIQFTGIKKPEDLTLNLLKPKFGETSIAAFTDKQVLVDASAA